MLWIGADDKENAFALDDLALGANFLDGSSYFHSALFIAVDYSPFGQIVGTHLERYFVPRQEPNIVDTHATRYVSQNFMTIIEADTERRTGQCFQNLTFDANQFFVVGHILYEDFIDTRETSSWSS